MNQLNNGQAMESPLFTDDILTPQSLNGAGVSHLFYEVKIGPKGVSIQLQAIA